MFRPHLTPNRHQVHSPSDDEIQQYYIDKEQRRSEMLPFMDWVWMALIILALLGAAAISR